ncbi:chromosomal replication initiator DnaA [Brevundimonas sp.]|uniref:chromosomal replication initiator DnaA n=1 Tax=Brevundimonas sp. TaxID=1871086 RepID=UPI0035B29DBE
MSVAPQSQMRLPLERNEAARPLVVSGCNAAAAAALETFPQAPGAILALVGPRGCGKSRMAEDWAERVGAVPLHGAEAALIDPLEIEGRPVMLDVAEAADDESLFHLFNLTQSGGGALLLVSRTAPATWETTVPDLRSRLNATPVAAIAAPDDVLMTVLLEAAFARRSMTPGEEVVAYLLKRIDRSAEAAEAVVEALDAAHRPVTRALARQVLGAADNA